MSSRALVVVAVVALLGLTACSGESKPLISQASLVAHDPALKFDTTRGGATVSGTLTATSSTDIDHNPPLALVDQTIIEATADGLSAKNISGAALWQTRSENPAREGTKLTAPIVSTLQGKHVAVAAFAVAVAGQGTSAGHNAIEVMAVDVANGEKTWSTQLPLPSAPDRVAEARVVSATDNGIVVTVPNLPHTWVVDPQNRQLRWQQTQFVAGSEVDGIVVGIENPEGVTNPGGSYRQRIAAMSIVDGSVKWTAADNSVHMSVTPAGPKLVAVDRTDPQETNSGQHQYNGNYFELLDAATGTVRQKIKHSPLSPKKTRCFYDEIDTTVCGTAPTLDSSGTGKSFMAGGYDASTGHQLWSLPSAAESRIAPIITGAWHGAVYAAIPKDAVARNTGGEAVVLDTRTGVDREKTPGAAPRLVNGYVGISLVYRKSGSAKQAFAHAQAFPTTD